MAHQEMNAVIKVNAILAADGSIAIQEEHTCDSALHFVDLSSRDSRGIARLIITDGTSQIQQPGAPSTYWIPSQPVDRPCWRVDNPFTDSNHIRMSYVAHPECLDDGRMVFMMPGEIDIQFHIDPKIIVSIDIAVWHIDPESGQRVFLDSAHTDTLPVDDSGDYIFARKYRLHDSCSSIELAWHTTFSNHHEFDTTIVTTEKLRIAVFSANPDPPGGIWDDEEIRSIQKAVEHSRNRDRIDVRPHLAARADDLIRVISDWSPHIVHFSGHGDSLGLQFSSPTADAEWIDVSVLVTLFAQSHSSPNLLVLNACNSLSLAEELCEHVDCVIGTTDMIHGNECCRFSTHFYAALCSGHSVERAFETGRMGISLANKEAFAIPKLFTRDTIDVTNYYLL